MIATLLLAVVLPVQSPPSGTVAGTVVITGGMPAELQRVSAVVVPEAARAASREDRVDVAGSATTDRDGRYRIEDLPPGRYHIIFGSVRIPTFYPGVRSADGATVVSVAGGATIDGVDFVVQPPLAVKVRGRVIGKTSADTLILNGESGDSFPLALPADGSFEFPEVPAGVYSMGIWGQGGPGPATWQIVVGDRDITGVEIIVPADKEITGKVQLEDGSAIPPFRLRLSANAVAVKPAESLTPGTVTMSRREFDDPPDINVNTTADGTFRMTLPEGTWQIGIDGIPSGFHLQSATYGTTNLRAGAVKVTAGESPELRVTLGRGLAPGTTIVKGRVVGVGSSVELGSYDGPLSFRAPVAADGTFEFFSIPPGSYAAIVLTGGGVSITPVKVGPAGVSDLVITTNPPEVGRNN